MPARLLMARYALEKEVRGGGIFNAESFLRNEMGSLWKSYCRDRGCHDLEIRKVDAPGGKSIRADGSRSFSEFLSGRILVSPVPGEEADGLGFSMHILGVRPPLSYLGIGDRYVYRVRCTVSGD